MKRYLSLGLGLVLILGLLGCERGGRISLNIPLDYFDEDLIGCPDLQEGVESIDLEGDQVVLVMKEKSYRLLMGELRSALEEELDQLHLDEDCSYVRRVDYLEDFSQVQVFVDGQEYEESLDWTPMLITLLGETYQAYDGGKSGIHIDYIDLETGEILTSLDYPGI